MGANEFLVVVQGHTMDEAFQEAVRSAQWEHGHGGYSGTIAEKSGYVDFGELPVGVLPSELRDRIWDYEEGLDWDTEKSSYDGPHAQLLAKIHVVYRDKWGPAVGFSRKDGIKYIFMGLASS